MIHRKCCRATDFGLTNAGNSHRPQFVPEPHGHSPARVIDFWRRQTGLCRQFSHLQSPPSPALDDAAPIEGIGDQRVPGQGLVRREQLLRRQPEMQRP